MSKKLDYDILTTRDITAKFVASVYSQEEIDQQKDSLTFMRTLNSIDILTQGPVTTDEFIAAIKESIPEEATHISASYTGYDGAIEVAPLTSVTRLETTNEVIAKLQLAIKEEIRSRKKKSKEYVEYLALKEKFEE